MDPPQQQQQQQHQQHRLLTQKSSPSSSSSSSSMICMQSLTRFPLYPLLALWLGSWACLGCIWTLVLLQLCVRPFSVPLYRRWSNRMASCPMMDTLALLASQNTTIRITADSDIPSPMNTCIFVCNHVGSQDVDWWCMMLLCRVLGFQGTIKTFCQRQQQQEQAQQNILSSLTPFVLHTLLEYPLLSSPDQEESYIQYKTQVSPLISNHTHHDNTPLHLLLFPEKMTAANPTWLAKSKACAQREGRPRLQHVLLPHTTAFYATLECIRLNHPIDAIHPVVYNVTLAYPTATNSSSSSTSSAANNNNNNKNNSGLNGFILSFSTLRRILMGHGIPSEIHVQIQKYNVESIAQDPSWLDKIWFEKDACLDSFYVHGTFPQPPQQQQQSLATTRSVRRSNHTRQWIFSSRTLNIENSIQSFLRLVVIPWMIPILIFFSFPIVCMMMWVYLATKSFQLLFHGGRRQPDATSSSSSSIATTVANTTTMTATKDVNSDVRNNGYKMSENSMMTSTSHHHHHHHHENHNTDDDDDDEEESEEEGEKRRNEASSMIITPMVPPTPFASPTTHVSSWITSATSTIGSSSGNN